MNLNIIRPKNETEDLLLSITKKCELLFKQTHKIAEETLDFKLTKSSETFHFNPPILIEGSWAMVLTPPQVYNSVFKKTHEKNKFKLYTETFDGFPIEGSKGELEEIVNASNISHDYLHDEIIGPRIISAYKKLETGKRQTDGHYLLMGYARSLFRDFESFLRIVIGPDEDDI